MSRYNPLEAVKRLEASGIPRAHAEAIAAEIWASKCCRATEVSTEQGDSALDRLTVRLSLLAVAAVLLACVVLGMLLFGRA
jgi:hypothetical protein